MSIRQGRTVISNVGGIQSLLNTPRSSSERDPKTEKALRSGPSGARSSFPVVVRACPFYAPAIAAFRKERLSFGSDRFCRTENIF